MPDDPVLIAETQAWLRKAAHDLRAAGHSLTASPPLLDDVVFHCQQTAEKALKGFLLGNNIPFRKTHSLEEIGEQCLDLDSTLRDVVDRAVPHFSIPPSLEDICFRLQCRGTTPIITHPEKHPIIQERPDRLGWLIDLGCRSN